MVKLIDIIANIDNSLFYYLDIYVLIHTANKEWFNAAFNINEKKTDNC